METRKCPEILKIKDIVDRAKENGMDVSQYTLRRAIKQGKLPCRIVGRTYLISWNNFISWVSCEESCDNPNFAPLSIEQ